jgi:hypothetical protein
MRISLFLVVLTGCADGSVFGVPQSVSVAVSLRVQNCDPALDPFTGVTFLGVRLSGEAEKVTAITGVQQSVTVVAPIASGLSVEVRGYDADPSAGGKVISRGISAPFATVVTDAGAVAPPVQVFFRRANAFTPAFSIANGGGCHQAMLNARAGHMATSMNDGTVFITGGYDFAGDEPEALYSSESFEPASDLFVARHELSIVNGLQRLPRARASSVPLPGAQMMIWGGESYAPSGVPGISAIVMVYDSGEDNFAPLAQRQSPPVIFRSRHHAVVDADGRVVIAGGITRDSNGQLVPVPEVEWCDTNFTTFVASGVSLPGDGAAMGVLQGGHVISVAGGSDGTALVGDATLLKWTGTTFAISGTPIQISPRRDAASAVVLGTNHLFLAGGFSDPGATNAIATTELVDTVAGVSAAGPAIAPRGEACAVALDEFDVLIAGGRDGTGASAAAERVHFDASGGMNVTTLPPLPIPRYQHSCTLLADGTVLIAGGVNGATVLQDAYVFQP